VNSLADKITNAKFTLQFNCDNPLHLMAIELLNRQNERGKARYIVNALLHFENCEGARLDANNSVYIIEKMIEPIVIRIIRVRERNIKENSGGLFIRTPDYQQDSVEEIIFDDTVDTLSEENITAVAGELDMFKKR